MIAEGDYLILLISPPLLNRCQQNVKYPRKPRNEEHRQDPGEFFAAAGFTRAENDKKWQ